MPAHPRFSAATSVLPGAVFSKLASRLASMEGEKYPLHVGDTWLEPAPGCAVEDVLAEEHPGIHRYADPHGHPLLLEALEEDSGADRSRILVTAGCTGALGAVAGASLDPGDEVAILAPFWPLIRGIVRSNRGRAVEVPYYLEDGTARDRIERHLTERTAAIYVNTPNNPTGRVLCREDLAGIAALARERGLWLWADETYERHAYVGNHLRLAEFAPERTFTARSFSKTWGMAGYRVGCVVGPEDPAMTAEVRKIATHTFYSAPTPSQIAAARVLAGGGDWLAESRRIYAETGAAAAELLGMPAPEGGTFLFADASAAVRELGMDGLLEECLRNNLLIAPGSACGEDFGAYVRVCFTSVRPDVALRGIERLGRILRREPRRPF
jgi:N-succinyldiaminopimelate aminotransferase